MRTLYAIYDLVYDYDYHYRLKEEHASVKKEDLPQYRELIKVMFDCSIPWDMKKYSKDYAELLKVLQDHQK